MKPLNYIFCICVFLFVLCAKTTAQTVADVQDSLTLVKFQKAVMAKGWPQYWDTSKPVSNWAGVEIEHKTGKVTAINIRGEKFPSIHFKTDSIPYCLCHLLELNSLKSITFANMDIKHISGELWKFKNLEQLGLHYNSLKKIPEGINKLTNLKCLFLGNNKFQTLPLMNNLSKLEYLSLTYNPNFENLPANIGELNNLQKLYVNYLGIKSVPKSIGKLKKLQTLILSCNKLESLPDEIGECSALKKLEIDFNQLESLPEQLDGLLSINYLNIKNNKIHNLPASILSKKNIRIIAQNNQLSGELKLSKSNVPAELNISNNHYTFKDIVDHIYRFNGTTHIITYTNQAKIGTERSYAPLADAVFNLQIDNYTPASGCTFKWYRKANINTLWSGYSTEQTLTWNSFNPKTDGGFYYCEVTHPDMPDLLLQSEQVKVIGTDNPPTVQINDVKFRQGTKGTIVITVSDDFSSESDLQINWPTETEHFILSGEKWNQRTISHKDVSFIGSDQLMLEVTDESGNKTLASATITALSAQNQPPVISITEIPMYFMDGYVPGCTPGTPGCNDFYAFTSFTRLENFITDDMDSFKSLHLKVLETNSQGNINGDPNTIVDVRDNIAEPGYMYADFLTYGDAEFIVTLEVTDSEGGVSSQPIKFICNATTPLKKLEIAPIGDQSIVKGETFEPLNLFDYVSVHTPTKLENLSVTAISPKLQAEISNGISMVKPADANQHFESKISYTIKDKLNEEHFQSIDVNYSVLDGNKISGTITDRDGNPLSNIALTGFSKPISTNTKGEYAAYEVKGWTGTVEPLKNGLSFIPSQLEINALNSDIEQHFVTDITLGTNGGNANKLVLYPNPATAHFTLICPKGKGQISIYSLGGQMVLSKTLTQARQKVNIPQLNKGVYLVKVEIEKATETIKLIVR